jgi:hypothetical protein
MNDSAKLWLGRLFFLVLGAAAGLAGGTYYGFKQGMTSIVDMSVSKDARWTKATIAALQDLRAGKTAAGLEEIEARLDDQLVMFDPSQPLPLSPKTAAEVDAALKDAASYRAAHPRKSSRKMVDDMVSNLLARQKR